MSLKIGTHFPYHIDIKLKADDLEWVTVAKVSHEGTAYTMSIALKPDYAEVRVYHLTRHKTLYTHRQEVAL